MRKALASLKVRLKTVRQDLQALVQANKMLLLVLGGVGLLVVTLVGDTINGTRMDAQRRLSLKNQAEIVDQQKQIMASQKEILQNEATIIGNQRQILRNHADILARLKGVEQRCK